MTTVLSEAVSWIRANPTAFAGYVAIGVGILFIALTAIVKTKAESAAASERTRDESKRKLGRKRKKRLWLVYSFMLLAGVGLNVLGNLLTKRAGEVASERQLGIAKTERQQEIEQAKGETRELREKLQSILVAINAAKREDSKKITEEKMRVIQIDLAKWAEEFDANLVRRKTEFATAKSENERERTESANKEKQRQIKVSGQAYPAISFAVRFVEDSVRAYAKRAGKDVKIETFDLSENFYGRSSNCCVIRFNEKASWTLAVGTTGNVPGLAYHPERLPYLKITFLGNDGNPSGMFALRPITDQQKLAFVYSPVVPTPKTVGITGERGLNDYETVIRAALQPIIEEQILQLAE